MLPADVPSEPGDMTRFIEHFYHARHREALPRLAALAAKVERVHAATDGVPSGLSALLHKMIGQMEVHMKKEELILFPAIRKGGAPGIERPIAVMRDDHDEHSADISRLRELTQNLTPPPSACGTWTTLYSELAAFIRELEQHIRLENEVLFPLFEPAPTADACCASCGALDAPMPSPQESHRR